MLAGQGPKHRFPVLDGWRGISILVVMAGHMLPLGPKILGLNHLAGYLGMSLFFTLSGFLITYNIYNNKNVLVFLIRRCMRIMPLAYIYLLVAFLVQEEPIGKLFISFFFLENYIHYALTSLTAHFWSLCVEFHFYIALVVLMYITSFKGFKFIPIFLLLILVHSYLS